MDLPEFEQIVLLAKFGEMVTIWNRIEQSFRNTLMYAMDGKCPPSAEAQITTTHMGISELCGAFRTIATELKAGDLQERMLHCVRCIEQLRAYRNYYVHGFTQVGFKITMDGKDTYSIGIPDIPNTTVDYAVGFLQMESAAARLISHEKIVTMVDLVELCNNMQTILDFVVSIYAFMRDGNKLPSWHQIPALLERLMKPRQYPLGDTFPPLSSYE